MPLLSLCATNYRTHPVTGRSLDSIVSQVSNLDCEIVVVDNFSEDGSYETLTSYRAPVPIRVVQMRCSRGVGRQLAFRMSRGEYVVTFDLDTVYNRNWGKLLRALIERPVPFAVTTVYSQFYPRRVLEAVGGWRSFQYWEDVDLWIRLAARGVYRTYPMITGENLKRTPGRDRVEKILRLYARCRDKVAVADWIPFRLYAGGYLSLLRRPRLFYHFSIFLLGYAAGRIKRYRLCGSDYDTGLVRNKSLEVDCGIVPRKELASSTSPYNTTEGCEEALRRGVVGFLPGTYD